VDFKKSIKTVADYTYTSPHKKGDFLHFKDEYHKTTSLKFTQTNENGGKKFRTKTLVFTDLDRVDLRFQKAISEDEYLVYQKVGEEKKFFKVKRQEVSPSVSNQQRLIKEKLTHINNIKLEFSIGEKIRFRSGLGPMIVGKITDKTPSNFIVQLSSGKKCSRSEIEYIQIS